ncbi:MAG TPA: Ku protein [Polyangiales bacterium]|nr:Ku protein [Polyangiales bacterium]
MPRSAHKRASSSKRRERSTRSAKPEAEQESSPALRPLWSGTLSFGLVSIPVDLYPATRNARVSLRMLAPDGTPVARRYVRPDDAEQVPSERLVRGYEYERDAYVEVSDEELEALAPDKSRDIDLRLFVPADSIDPVYFDRAFFLLPSGDSNKAYYLLAAVMDKGSRAGIATFVMRDHEYLVAIFARGGLLTAEALRFHDQVRDGEGVGAPKKSRVSSELQAKLEKFLEQHSRDRFDPSTLVDEHTEALRKLATSKARKHADIVESAAAQGGDDEAAADDHVDLMRLLKQSLRSPEPRSSRRRH